MYTCRECERPINQSTEVCPYCGADLTEDAQQAAAAPKRKNIVSVLLRWGVLVLAMWAFLWYVLPERGDPAARAEMRAFDLLQEAQLALAACAVAQNGSYPPSLETLPRETRGAVQLAAQQALAEGYRIEYVPGMPNDVGRITSFALHVRAGRHGYRNFFTDQSGVPRATRENRAATASDPPL